MHRHDIRLAIVSDRPNQGIAKTYLSLLSKEESSYADCNCSPVAFDPSQPALVTEALEKQHVALAQVGIPGRSDYQNILYSFLFAYAAVKRKPGIGLVTHDIEHTRYTIDRWLYGAARSPHILPDGAVSIIDASRPLRSNTLQSAVDILMRNRPGGSLAVNRPVPFTEVQPRSVSFLELMDYRQNFG